MTTRRRDAHHGPRTVAGGGEPVGDTIVGLDDRILVTGAAGFIGSRVVRSLLDRGFRDLVCFVRPSSEMARLETILGTRPEGVRVEVLRGNLLTPDDCRAAAEKASVILHLAAGAGEKSYADAFMNSVVATRNLLEAAVREGCLRRFVHVSSFAVYSNTGNPRGRLLDESCPIETRPALRGEAYCFAKVKQEEIVAEYGKERGVPYVVVRPGYVYGPGKRDISGRVGVGTFGLFLHLGGRNTIPFTYVDNCADAIVLAGLRPGVDGDVFNIVDDDLPTSRHFLRQYKRHVERIRSVYLPHVASRALCSLWERYSGWSEGQLPPVFNQRRWHAYWKGSRYTNAKLKERLGWAPRVSIDEGFRRYFASCRERTRHA